jgi:F-type H+-transporting ATPase subunit delta
MKITTRQYALGLFEATEGKSEAEVKSVIKNFTAFLVAKNKLDIADKIIVEFVRIWNEKHEIVEAKITSAFELDKDVTKLLKEYIANLSGAKEVVVSEAIDKNLLGGVVIRYQDIVLDGSLQTRVGELKKRMEK